MATTEEVRFSTGKVAASDAANFSWERAIPVNPFWDDIDYCLARNFLDSFKDEEIPKLPIDPQSTAPLNEKLELLIKLLREKLSQLGPDVIENDYNSWGNVQLAIYSVQNDMDLPEAEDTLRAMINQVPEEKAALRLSNTHTLCDWLSRHGKYDEAEEKERLVIQWMIEHPKLGAASPQVLSSRRIIARCLWGQGKKEAAEAELAKNEEVIEKELPGTQFGVYQEEERELNKKLRESLEKMV